jgi:sugar (pentulose or hexulose) kinase
MNTILAIDTGSQSMRGILFDRSGTVLFNRQIPYFMKIDGGKAEQEPSDFRDALLQICQDTAAFLREPLAEPLSGIVLTSQRSSVIAADRQGNPLAPAIMWYDRRSQPICDEMNHRYGTELYRVCGILASPVMTAPKMAYLKANLPKIYERSFKLLTIHDYLLHMLTGRFVTDYSIAGRSCLFDIAGLRWSGEMLERFGLDGDKLPELCEPGSIVGKLIPFFCEQTGLPCVPVVTGGGDQQCAVLGQGLLEQGDIGINTGTGAYVVSIMDSPAFGPPGRVNLGYSAVPGKWMLEANTLSSGSVYQWLNKNFYPAQTDFKEIDREVSSVPPGANGVIALPDLSGKGCPDWDGDARGVLWGISFSTCREDCARAVLEGIACEIAECYYALSETVRVRADFRICSAGGLSKLEVFNQMLADMIGKPVEHCSMRELTAVGAWINAVVALGFYDSRAEAFQTFYKNTEAVRFRPRPKESKVYEKLLRVRKTLEKSLPNYELTRYQAEVSGLSGGKND